MLPTTKQSGAILPVLVLIVLGAAVVFGTKLVDLPQIFKSKADYTSPIYFTGPNIQKDDRGVLYTTTPKVELALTSPFSSINKPLPTNGPTVTCGGLAGKQCPNGFVCTYNTNPYDISSPSTLNRDPYPDEEGVCLPKPDTEPLTCGGVGGLICPPNYVCQTPSYPDDPVSNTGRAGLCVPSKGVNIPAPTTCSDNPCPQGQACVDTQDGAMCVSNAQSPTSTLNFDRSLLDDTFQDTSSLVDRKKLSEEGGSQSDLSLTKPDLWNYKCIYTDPNDDPTISLDWQLPSDSSGAEVFIDDATAIGWSGSCDKSYSDDKCQDIKGTDDPKNISIEPNTLYNLWIRSRDSDGSFGPISRKMPIYCPIDKGPQSHAVGYRLAEDQESLKYVSYSHFSAKEGTTIVPYIFSDLSLGPKTVWVEFLDNNGKSEISSATIELRAPDNPPTNKLTVTNVKRVVDTNRIQIYAENLTASSLPITHNFEVYISFGGDTELMAKTSLLSSDYITVDLNPILSQIPGQKLTNLSGQYIRICRTDPSYECSEYTTIPTIPATGF